MGKKENGKQEKKSSVKSLSVIDILEDGTLYLEVGNESSDITSIGKPNKKEFVPYVTTIPSIMLSVFYTYKIKLDYIPSNYKSVDEFIEVINNQSIHNEYISNWVDIAAKELKKVLNKKGLLDETIFAIGINSNNHIFDRFFTHLTTNVAGRYDTIFVINSNLDEGNLKVLDFAPNDIKRELSNKFKLMNREDRYYTFDQLNIPDNQQSYIDGLLKVREDMLIKLKNKKVILVVDFFKNGKYIKNVVSYLDKYDVQVLSAVSLARLF